ncbi:MAG: phosphatidylglycerophosphatase A [Cytophagales bacterium]|nr:phosphatidylglycerophosphatase A [Cytophagales bacterium]
MNTPPYTPPYIPPLQPTARFLFSHPAHFIALGAGSGLSRLAPGTVGTLWAWLAFGVLQSLLAPVQIGWVIAATAIVSIWAGMRTAQHLQVMDPGSIVIDEIVAFWLILWFVSPTTFWGQLGAFVLFRFFDAAKPGPVGWADRTFKGFGWRGGFGILFDDLVAAFCVLVVFAVVRF